MNWQKKLAENPTKAYEKMKNAITLSTEYAFYKVTFIVTDGLNPVRKALVTLDDETKSTGTDGKVVFYKRAGNNYYYEVYADEYTTDSDNDNLIDVTNTDVTVEVVLS